MGLPLYNPTGSILYLSELEPEPEHSGILSRRLGGPTPSPKHRRPHRHLHRSTPPLAQPLGDYHPTVLKSVPEHSHPDRSCNRPSYPLPKLPRSLNDLDVETREGRDLARSSPCLPRRPSLEREEAFCGERPAKKRCLPDAEPEASDETVQELYRLGLLYDNPHERGERFTFDAIVHDEPLYNVNVRKSKRGRWCRGAGRRGTPDSWHYSLPLELSFAALEDDERMARLLMAPEDDELVSVTELNRWTAIRAIHRHLEGSEVAGPSVTETQLSVISPSSAPHAASTGTVTQPQSTPQSLPASQDFPEMVSDSEHDDAEVVEWEVLDDSQSDGDGATAGAEAWVVLG
ncbi:hypothetical protein CONLIGDRAFT_163165 [Coniochaeta ligniaria NRRL 30616]|uniref:Uncharacterized protein n=1 Tax=Coniochaeta ligniaria NRRL 30616 TaxID=1408157 RepID=A0A1J7JT04_9PEZI|nr:hypothetical protein CONLIGDRAFT_163165 [Coniochaeta ligniaria NRRL 30616]